MVLILLSYYITDIKLVKKGVFKWTAKSFIKKEMLVDLPAHLDTSDFREIEGRIRSLGYYFDVRVYPADSLADTTELIIELTEGWYIAPNFNFYKDEEAGWVMGVGVNIVNLLGRNYYLSFLYKFLGETSYYVSFGKNWSRGTPFNFSIDLGRVSTFRVVEKFNEEKDYFSGKLGFKVKKILTPEFSLSYVDLKSDSAGKTISPQNNDIYLESGVDIRVDTRNEAFHPEKGFYLFSGFNHYYGLKPSFNIEEVMFHISLYIPITEKRDILAIYTEYHGFYGEQVPSYLKLYLGGSNSVRGWDFGELRGNHIINARVEYRNPIVPLKRRNIFFLKDVLTGIFFYSYYDFGVVGEESLDDFLKFDYIDGVGFGLNFFFPYIGGVRPELERVESRWKLNLGMGWSF